MIAGMTARMMAALRSSGGKGLARFGIFGTRGF
jgi:hypothetical protein